jgi:hypothetical protein
MSTRVDTRPGRYTELTDEELADTVECAHEAGDTPDWELVLELTRRLITTEPRTAA